MIVFSFGELSGIFDKKVTFLYLITVETGSSACAFHISIA